MTVYQLFYAIKSDDSAEVQAAIADGTNINAAYDFDEITRDPNTPSDPRPTTKYSPLDYAAELMCFQAARALLDAGAHPDIADSGESALFASVRHQEWDFALLLLAKGANPNRPAGTGYAYPLHLALSIPPVFADKSIVKALLDHGANPNVIDRWGATPIMLAAAFANMDAWAALLAKGADISMTDKTKTTVMHYACLPAASVEPRIEEIHQHLINAGQGQSRNAFAQVPLHIAARSSLMQSNTLLRSGAPVPEPDATRGTYLLYAAEADRIRMSEAIAIDPKVDAADEIGRNAVFFCAANLKPDDVRLLIAQGCPTNQRNHKGRTVLHHVLFMRPYERDWDKQLEILNVLLGQSPDFYARDADGKNHWHYVLDYDYQGFNDMRGLHDRRFEIGSRYFFSPEDVYPLPPGAAPDRPFNEKNGQLRLRLVRALIGTAGCEAGIDDRDKNSLTPILTLCGTTWYDAEDTMLRILLARRADPTPMDENGNTALHLICDRSDVVSENRLGPLISSVDALCASRADVNARNFKGKTPKQLTKWEPIKKVLIKYGG